MSPSDQPPVDLPPPGDAPAVGNVLGFSLLFRERKALLALGRRGLAPGVRLRDYEAEIPGVSFPLRAPLSASEFRNRRCRAVRVALTLEDRALRPWLEGRLVGADLGGVRWQRVDFELRRRLPDSTEHRPFLHVEGCARDGGFVWLSVAFELDPRARLLRLVPVHHWLVGDLAVDARQLWSLLARRLRPEAVTGEDGSMMIDPPRLALVAPFVSVGWRAPDLAGLAVESIVLERRAVTVELRRLGSEAGATASVPAGAPRQDSIARALDEVRGHLTARDRPPMLARARALAVLEQISAAVQDFPAAALAVVRWRVELSRFCDHAAAIDALHEWLDMQPSAPEARRALLVALAAAGQVDQVARLLAEEARRPHSPTGQARLELAIAALLVERLEDARSALAMIGPLVGRLREGARSPARESDARIREHEADEHGALLTESLVVLACARAAEATRAGRTVGRTTHALDALEEATQRTNKPERRADMRARVARTFARCGAHAQALQLLSRAIVEDPESDSLVDEAIELSLRVGEKDAAVALLLVRIDPARGTSLDEQHELRRRLIAVLAELADLDDREPPGHAEHRALARAQVDLALEHEPDSPALLRLAATLAHLAGDPLAAADHLERLLELPPPRHREAVVDERQRTVPLVVERARLLRAARHMDEAWECLHRALALDLEAPLAIDVLELALEIAPPRERPPIIDRLIAVTRGPRRAEALLERAARAIKVEDRLRDLWAAAREVDPPTEVLAQIESLVDDGDLAGLSAVADLSSTRGAADVELSARVRLADRMLAAERTTEALAQLVRALELDPDRGDLACLAGDLFAKLGRFDAAADLLLPVFDSGRAFRRDADRRARDSVDPDDRIALAERCVELLDRCGRSERAITVMRELLQLRADDVAGARLLAEQLFDRLLAAGNRREAFAFAQARCERGEAVACVPWLLRAAELAEEIDPTQRRHLLERALALAPDDGSIADQLTTELLALDDRAAVEAHLRARLERGGSDEQRRALLLAWIGVIEADGDDPSRALDLSQAHAALLAVDPDHAASLLALGALRHGAGDDSGALEPWARAVALLAEDDPRLFQPSLLLARHALLDGEAAQARTHCLRMLRLRPDDPIALAVAHDVAIATADTGLTIRACEGLLADLRPPWDAAALEFEQAGAHARDGATTRAFACLRRACERVDRGSALHLESAETWLALATSDASLAPTVALTEELAAREQLADALGRDLALADLVRLCDLLLDPAIPRAVADRQRGRDRALDLLEQGLLPHRAPDLLLTRFVAACNEHEASDRLLPALGRVLDGLRDDPARLRVIACIVDEARRRDDAAAALHALDRVPAEHAADAWILAHRGWAARALGRSGDELARVDEALRAGARAPALLDHYASLVDGDELLLARRVLAAGSTAPAPIAVGLAIEVLARLADERPLPLAERERLRIAAAAELLRRRELDAVRAAWRDIARELAGIAAGTPERELLVEFAATAAAGEDPELLAITVAAVDDLLQAHPRDRDLHRALASALLGDELDRQGGRDPREAWWHPIVAHLESLADDAGLDDEGRVELLVGAAESLPIDETAQLLVDRIDAHAGVPRRYVALVEALRRLRRWRELSAVYESIPATPVWEWQELAAGAHEDGDAASEGRARAHAGRLLLAECDAGDPGARGASARLAVDELKRSVELRPDAHELLYALARALELAGDTGAALGHYLSLVRGDRVAVPGIEDGSLARHCGRLLAAAGDLEDAVDMFVLALSRLPAGERDAASEELYDTYVELDFDREAAQVAANAAAVAETVERELEWLRRASALIGGPPRVALLRRARAIAPLDDDLRDDLEDELRSLGDGAGVEALLRERLARADQSAERVHALEALLEHLDGESPQHASDASRAELWAALLAADPNHLEAMSQVARHHEQQGEIEEAAGLWTRIVASLAPGDPRGLAPARRLAARALEHDPPDLAAARTHLLLALEVTPGEEALLEDLRRVGHLTADPALVQRAVRPLLARGASRARTAELERDSAIAAGELGETTEALAAFRRAVELTEVGSEFHRELTARWLRMVAPSTGDWRIDEVDARAREAEARAHLRAGLGPELSAADRAREIELLSSIDKFEVAIDLLEAALVLAPRDAVHLEQLARLCEAPERADRLLAVLRRVLDAQSEPELRDEFAARLATAARGADVARTALYALERLSGPRAGEPAMLDLREWAIRKLGKVDDELVAIDRELLRSRGDSLLVTRLLRMLEQDVEACGQRLLDLADDAARAEITDGAPASAEGTTAETRTWLAKTALELLRKHRPQRLPLALRALAMLVAAGSGPTRHFHELAELAITQTGENDAPLLALAEIAERGEAAGQAGFTGAAENLLARALVLHPQRAALHERHARLLAGRFAGQLAPELRRRCTELADEARLDDRARGQLYLGAAGALAADDAREMLGELAATFRERPVLFAALREGLERRRAWPQLARVFDLVDTDTPRWLALADEAAADDDRASEALARHRAGSQLRARGEGEAARRALARAHQLAPDDVHVRWELGMVLDSLGDVGALELLLPLIDSGTYAPPEAEAEPLALTCARLAETTGEHELALRLRAATLARSHGIAHERAAEPHFELLLALGRVDEAIALATHCATLPEHHEWAWLERAAAISRGRPRAEILARLLRLRNDAGVADELTTSLRELDDRPALESHLRECVAAGVAVGDTTRAVAGLRELLTLVGEGEDRTDLLESLVRLDPQQVDAHLELGARRFAEEEADLAILHWKRAGELLEARDPRFLAPARELAGLAILRGDLHEARTLLERASQIDPGDAIVLGRMLEVARVLADDHLVLATIERSLARTSPTAGDRYGLELESAGALRRLGRPDEAAAALERACAAAPPRSSEHVEAANRWLRLTLAEDFCAAVDEGPRRLHEAAARAALRSAQGDALPVRALCAEAELLADSLHDLDGAIRLLSAALRRAPADVELLATLEGCCDRAGRPGAFTGALDEILDADEVRAANEDAIAALAERLARHARQLGDADCCLRALERRPGGATTVPELAALREWAIRELGRIGEELLRIERALAVADASDRREALAGELLHFLDGDASEGVRRLLIAADGEGADPVELARLAMTIARERAPDDLELSLTALTAVAARCGATAMAPFWAGVEALALARGELSPLVTLIGLAVDAESRDGLAYGERVEHLLSAALRIDPGDRRLHDLIERRCERLGIDAADAASRAGELGGEALAVFHGERARRLDPRRAAHHLLEQGRRNVDDRPARAAFARALGERHAWPELLELLDACASADASVDVDALLALADRAAEDADRASEFAARVRAGRHLMATGMPSVACRPLARAHELAAEEGSALVSAPERGRLQYELGRAYEESGRLAHAIEHLLPLVDSLAADPTLPLPCSATELALRSARLLIELSDLARATVYLARARSLHLAADGAGKLEPTQLAAAETTLHDLYVRTGQHEQALSLALAIAADASSPTRLAWLRRAAALARGPQRIAVLDALHHEIPEDDAVTDVLESELRSAGELAPLKALLYDRLRRCEREESAGELARAVASRLLPLVRADAERPDDSSTSELRELLPRMIQLAPDDPELRLDLAELLACNGDEPAAAAQWRVAGELLPRDDERFWSPSLALARIAVAAGDVATARGLLERARSIRPGAAEPLLALRAIADDLHDPELVLELARSLFAHDDHGIPPRELELDAAEALFALGRVAQSLAAFERAAVASRGGEMHAQVAARWVEVASTDGGMVDAGEARLRRPLASLEAEAAARAELRAALGLALAAGDLRAEANLLVRGLGRDEEGLSLLEQQLERVPGDELTVSTLKDLCVAVDRPDRYVATLARAVERLDPGPLRDRLGAELAFAAVGLDDAQRLLAALDQISPSRAAAPELLDLRDWAIRKLDRVELEVHEVDRRLLTTPDLGVVERELVPRLLRMFDQDLDALLAHLLELCKLAEVDVAARIGELVLGLLAAHADELPRASAVRRGLAAVEASLREGAPRTSASVVRTHWELLAALVAGEPGDVANWLGLAERAVAVGVELGTRPQQLLVGALARAPDAIELHRLLARDFAHEPADQRLAAVHRGLEALAARTSLVGAARARLWVGMASLLERREAADLLLARAELELAASPVDAAALLELVRTLELANQWMLARELLERQISRTDDPDRRVEVLKHLAHLCTDVLGDPAAAIGHLEEALALAPDDPDLLLPMLDEYYARSRLDRAIELSVRVMERVAMGDVAFAALGNRAADAALARGDHEGAESLLAKVLVRIPGDTRTAARMSELHGLAGDPSHRVQMLAAIADRQTGSARVEALEERARLLVDPLGRFDEAIENLEAILHDQPARRESADHLAALYERRQRWPELAALVERDFQRTSGRERSELLRRLAAIHADRLYDAAAAERALRLAIDNLAAAAAESADGQLRDACEADLAACLQAQGRFSDLAAHLEELLAPDLAGAHTPSELRVGLLELLASTYRDHLEDPPRAARIYARLESVDLLPETGLATLARWYRSQHRHEDLARLLMARSRKLGEAGEVERKAEADFRIGELLEGPLRRPHEAARYFLDAYLADPDENAEAGARARVLLSGTDSIVNVRRRLLKRLESVPEAHKPALDTLLADLLAPQDEHEAEAEERYRLALTASPELAPALEGLGRLLARQGRLEEAIASLVPAASSLYLDPRRAADDAAIAARALLELGRVDEAESVLKQALGRAPTAERALLELSRLYSRTHRARDEAHVLDDLAELKLSSLMRAEVAYRRAMLLASEFQHAPHGEAGERARGYLLEAVGADAMHAQARQVLLELATVRGEWSIVAHMHFLAIRELGPGVPRALRHLDLAETYLDHLDDEESALRNLASALQIDEASEDLIVFERTKRIIGRLRAPQAAAERFAALADQEGGELGPIARARACLLAAELDLGLDDHEQAKLRVDKILEIEGRAGPLPRDITDAARRHLEELTRDDVDLIRARKAVQKLLESEEQAVERLHLFSRLRELARKLGDGPLVEHASQSLIELANRLAKEDRDRDEAIFALRELFAERGDFVAMLQLYEDLAARTVDPVAAANTLIDAARVAWSGLRDPRLAVAILRRALDRHANLPVATTILAEIAGSTEDPEVDATICDELSQLDPSSRPPLLALRLAEAARRLGRREQAHSALRQLLAGAAPAELRHSALTQLDGLLAHAGRTVERLPVLEERLVLARGFLPDRASEAALDLARTQRALGNQADARRTCTLALDAQPSHLELALLRAELVEQAEDWPSLVQALEHLARLFIDTGERARWLTRAAWVHLERLGSVEALTRARNLLVHARGISSTNVECRTALLPLEFDARRWDAVLEICVEIRALAGDDDEVLIIAAIAEAFASDRRTLARAIGARHSVEARARTLWPALAKVLEILALEGPLPRLDAVLSASAALCGGTEELFRELASWTAAQRTNPGATLAMARLQEAFGHMDLARDLFQLTAFLAPTGPVTTISSRLGEPVLPEDPLRRDEWVPVEWRGALRELLIHLRESLAGIRVPDGSYITPSNAIERATIQTAGRLAARWRDALGVPIPIRLTRDPLVAGVGVRNDPEPLIVVNEEFIAAPEAERSFRLAMAAAAIATGAACVADTHPVGTADLVDALLVFTRPRHLPTQAGGAVVADVLAARGLRAASIPGELRETIERELAHWERVPDSLLRTIRRACMVMATRLSGSLEGAMMALGRDAGRPHGTAAQNLEIVESADAQWLIRSLGLGG